MIQHLIGQFGPQGHYLELPGKIAGFGKPHASEYDTSSNGTSGSSTFVQGNTDGVSYYYEHEKGLDQIREGAT